MEVNPAKAEAMKDESDGGAQNGSGSNATAPGATAPSRSGSNAAVPSGRGLSVGVEAAWGLRTRPAKGPRPVLDLDRIVTAAVRLAQTDGLAAVSMSKFAAAVDAT